MTHLHLHFCFGIKFELKKRLFHNSVCSLLWGNWFAILSECSQLCLRFFVYRNSRGNPSLCWLGGGGVNGDKKPVNKYFVNKRAFRIDV